MLTLLVLREITNDSSKATHTRHRYGEKLYTTTSHDDTATRPRLRPAHSTDPATPARSRPRVFARRCTFLVNLRGACPPCGALRFWPTLAAVLVMSCFLVTEAGIDALTDREVVVGIGHEGLVEAVAGFTLVLDMAASRCVGGLGSGTTP